MNKCGARNRRGLPCGAWGFGLGGRCHYHGGVGPKPGSIQHHRVQNIHFRGGARSVEGKALAAATTAWRQALEAMNAEPDSQDAWRRALWALQQREKAQAAFEARKALAALAHASLQAVAQEPALCAQLPPGPDGGGPDGCETQATEDPGDGTGQEP